MRINWKKVAIIIIATVPIWVIVAAGLVNLVAQCLVGILCFFAYAVLFDLYEE